MAHAGGLAVKADHPVHRAGIRMLQERLAALADPKDAAADAAVSEEWAAAVTNAFSLARKVTWARAAVVKASVCCPVSAGPNTNFHPRIWRVRPAPAPVTTLLRTAATGSALAKAARPRVRTSALRGSTPNGWCSAPRPSTTKANCCGMRRRARSQTTLRPTTGCSPRFAKARI